MKKVFLLATALVAGTMMFTSCGKESVDKGPATITAPATYEIDATSLGLISIPVTVAAPVDAELESVTVKVVSDVAGSQTTTTLKAITSFKTPSAYTFVIMNTAGDDNSILGLGYATGMKEIHIISQVKDGGQTEKIIALTVKGDVVNPTDDLAAATSFSWVRTGNEETVYSPVGLKFGKSNVAKAVYTQIVKGTATKMVDLSADFGKITKKADLKAKIDAGSEASVIKQLLVDGAQDKDYQIAIGTIVGAEYYLVNITHAKVETVSAGTKITVTTSYQK